MAGKARRAASRQGELGRRRKKNQRGPAGVPSVTAQPSQISGTRVAVANSGDADASLEDGASRVPGAAAEVAPQAPRFPVRPAPQSRPQGRIRGERPAAYNYVGSELRRIALLSTAVLAALVVLSVVL